MSLPESIATEVEMSPLAGMLTDYQKRGTVMGKIDEERKIGRHIATEIMRRPGSRDALLQDFKTMAPTPLEKVMARTSMPKLSVIHPDDAEGGEPTASAPHGSDVNTPHLFEGSADEPFVASGNETLSEIGVMNAHARMIVYMSAVRVLMQELHGKTYGEYRRYRDAFHEAMDAELREDDRRRVQSSEARMKKEADKDASKQSEPWRILTHDDFAKRLEDEIRKLSSTEVTG